MPGTQASLALLHAVGEHDQAAASEGAVADPRAPVLFDRRHRIVGNTAFEALCVVDDERRYVRVNRATVRVLGAPVERILGRRVDDFTLPEQLAELDRLWVQLRVNGTLEGPYMVAQGNGSVQPIRFRASWDYAPGEHLIAAIEAPRAPTQKVQPNVLTSRELEILELAAEGCSNVNIAERLVLSPATVKTHLQNAYRKLEVPDRAAAVATALRSGLFS